jgi:hypothetical protein
MLRFPSSIGDLTVEALWQLPLLAKPGSSKVDLDTIARACNAELREIGDVTFVKTDKPDPQVANLTMKLDVLKRIIEVKEAEKDAAEKAAVNAERKRKLLAALTAKEEAALVGMSAAEIEAEIAKL